MQNSTLRPARLIVRAGLVMAFAAATSPATAQSFDCSKASTASEIAVCENAQLATADLELAQLYKDVIGQAADPAALKAEQREWIAQRDTCGSDYDCLTGAYARRHDELQLSLTAAE